jgi:pimeloyl-ACP methyl ester carboxylesterase
MASTQHFTTNDGVQLAYEAAGSEGPVIVLIHGWSGSRKYFQRSIAALAAKCKVRFHLTAPDTAYTPTLLSPVPANPLRPCMWVW